MFRSRSEKFIRSTEGNVAVIGALCVIPPVIAATGVIEIQGQASAKGDLQAAVDAGALAGVQRLGVVNANGTSDVEAAAVTAAKNNQGTALRETTVSYSIQVSMSDGAVTVTGAAAHKALIGFMGFENATIEATATANALGSVPLCVLQTGSDKKYSGIQVEDQASIRASGCAVHANKDLQVDGGAFVQAGRASATGTVKGPVSPTGMSGALAIQDPFSSLNLEPPTACEGKATKYKVVKDSGLDLSPACIVSFLTSTQAQPCGCCLATTILWMT